MARLLGDAGMKFLEMSAADYHRDPCPEPSLSASMAKILTLRPSNSKKGNT
jgi:hypothetical protein